MNTGFDLCQYENSMCFVERKRHRQINAGAFLLLPLTLTTDNPDAPPQAPPRRTAHANEELVQKEGARQ